MFRHAGVKGEMLHINGKMEGKRGISQKQHSWMRNLRQWTGISNAETIFHLDEAAGDLCGEFKDTGDRPRA